jgi:hypothetical protein
VPVRLYLFTANVLALLMPAVVETVSFSLPNLAVAGTRHLMLVVLHEMYSADSTEPNFAKLAPRLAPNPLPVIVTVAPRFP